MFAVNLFVVCALQILVGSGAQPSSAFIGISGSGKTTIINNYCGAHLETGNGATRTTSEEALVECNGNNFYDTVGLFDLADGEHAENAYHRGLERLLNFLNGKSIARIYLVTMSTYEKDTARVIEQVDLLRSLMNPLIPWTTIVNCYNGPCSTDDEPEFIHLLKAVTDEYLEVISPHEVPLPKNFFPPPSTSFQVSLPENWRDLMVGDIKTLRDNIEAEARRNCDSYVARIRSAKLELASSPVCSEPMCVPSDCSTLPSCGHPTCPHYPCAQRSECKRYRRREYQCHCKNIPFGSLLCSTCHEDIYEEDQGCLNAVADCEQQRGERCTQHNRIYSTCTSNRNTQCAELTNAYDSCATSRRNRCTAISLLRNQSLQKVMNDLSHPYSICISKFAYAPL
jgi:hypothetical protein